MFLLDLTDEDDKQAKSPAVGNPIKILNKTMSSAGTPNKTIGVNKIGSGGKTVVSRCNLFVNLLYLIY